MILFSVLFIAYVMEEIIMILIYSIFPVFPQRLHFSIGVSLNCVHFPDFGPEVFFMVDFYSFVAIFRINITSLCFNLKDNESEPSYEWNDSVYIFMCVRVCFYMCICVVMICIFLTFLLL